MARVNLGKVVPEKGVDYFTEADKTELKEEIKQEIDAQGMAQAITELQLGSGHSVELTLNSQTYQLVLKLKNAAGNVLNTQSVDLPNENAITNIEYNNGVLTVTKQSGTTSQVDISGLIEGLVTESDFNTFTTSLQQTLQGITETIGAINVKNLQQDEAIEENYKVITKLQAENETLKSIIDQMPQVEGQGYNVTLEKTIKAPFIKFDIEGHSEQESTTGKNKFHISSATPVDVNTTYNKISDNEIEVSTINPATYRYVSIPIEVEVNTTHYFKANIKNSNSSVSNSWLAVLNSDDTNVLYNNSYSDSEIKSFNTGENTIVNIRLYATSNVAATNTTTWSKIQLTTNNNDAFEKYTGGQASPNPNYEQPIKSCGDYLNRIGDVGIVNGAIDNTGTPVNNDFYLKRVRSDLYLPLSAGSYILSYQGIEQSVVYIFNNNKVLQANTGFQTGNNSFTLTADGYITFAFRNSDNSEVSPKDLINVTISKSDGTYTISAKKAITEKIVNKNYAKSFVQPSYNQYSDILEIEVPDINKLLGKAVTISFISDKTGAIYPNENVFTTSAQKSVVAGKNSFTLTLKNEIPVGISTYTNGLLRVFKNYVSTNQCIFTDVQLEQGSTDSSYVLHEEQTVSMPTQAPFRSIGDVRDGFAKVNGVWNEVHPVFRKIFDGTEDWQQASESLPRFNLPVNNAVKGSNTNNPIKANRFRANYAIEDNSIFLSSASSMICIVCDDFSNITEFKEWLSNNNLEVIYKQVTPTYLPCTEEQIAILENLPITYKEQTNIISLDEVEAYLEVAGIYDTKDLVSRVEVLESEV